MSPRNQAYYQDGYCFSSRYDCALEESREEEEELDPSVFTREEEMICEDVVPQMGEIASELFHRTMGHVLHLYASSVQYGSSIDLLLNSLISYCQNLKAK